MAKNAVWLLIVIGVKKSVVLITKFSRIATKNILWEGNMKKLIFLLLILLAGFSVAFAAVNPTQPPGVFAEAVTMAEYGIHEGVVTQSTDIVLALPVMAESAILRAVTKNNESVVTPQFTISFTRVCSCGNCTDYYLLL